MNELKTKNQLKYSWIDSLEADEMRNVLYDMAEEIDNLKRAITTGNTKSSICLIKNTKGVNAEVKVYDDDADKAKSKAVELFNDLNARYNSGEE